MIKLSITRTGYTLCKKTPSKTRKTSSSILNRTNTMNKLDGFDDLTCCSTFSSSFDQSSTSFVAPVKDKLKKAQPCRQTLYVNFQKFDTSGAERKRRNPVHVTLHQKHEEDWGYFVDTNEK